MIEELKDIINSDQFKKMLSNPDVWESLHIDYHPPLVDRVWLRWNDCRICLHVIYPCERAEALVHPHPWPSAIYVLPIGGLYEHGIGGGREWKGNKMLCTQIVEGSMYYEMLHPDGIHYVRPIAVPSYSIMLMKPVEWEDNIVKPDKKLEPLTLCRKLEIINIFKKYLTTDEDN